MAISPSGQYLYVASLINLYQFDLWDTNVASSKDTVAISDTVSYLFPGLHAYFAALQLGPDNKIYGVAPSTGFIHVINQPDLGGDSCNVVNRQLNINFYNGFFMPNHPHYRMPAMSCSPLSVEESEANEAWNVTLYPNPTDDVLNVASNTLLKKGTSINVYNTLGQLLQTKILNEEAMTIQLNVKEWQDGIYLLQIMNGENKTTKSFSIAKD